MSAQRNTLCEIYFQVRRGTRVLTFATFLFAALACPGDGHATPSPISTGKYKNLLIGYDAATNVVTGYYSEESKAANVRPCRFYFYGTLEKSVAHIVAFLPDRPEATIEGYVGTFLPGHIAIGLDNPPSACSQETAFGGGGTTNFDARRVSIDLRHSEA